MKPLHPEILPKPQKEFWNGLGPHVPREFVLYGGTAVALRYGHRTSVDFDFFTDETLDEAKLRQALPALNASTVLQKAPNTLVVSLAVRHAPVKLSFFGGLRFGRVGAPDKETNRPAIASPIDLLATKLKALHDRIEAKDYLDIEVLLRDGGLTLDQGIAAALALFGRALNPLDTAKAVGWFKDGGLERSLPAATRDFLAHVSGRFDPATKPLPIKCPALAPNRPREQGEP